jgi:hypothetical protein
MMLQRSVWDSENDARQFFRAWSAHVEARYPDATPLEFEKDRLASWTTSEGGVKVWVEGVRVGVVEGAPSSTWKKLFPEE